MGMPPIGDVAVGSVAAIGFGFLIRLWVFLADFMTSSKGIEVIDQSPVLSETGKSAAREAQSIIRPLARKVIRPLSWILVTGGLAFLLIAAIEEFIL